MSSRSEENMAQLDGLAAMEDLKGALEAALAASGTLTTGCQELEQALDGLGHTLQAAVAEAAPARISQCRAAIDAAMADLGAHSEAAVHDIALFSEELVAADEVMAVQLFAPLRQVLDETGQARKLADSEVAAAYSDLQAAAGQVESAAGGLVTAIDDAALEAGRRLVELGASLREATTVLERAIDGMKSEMEAGQERLAAYLHDTWCPQLNAAIDAHEDVLGRLGANDIRQALDHLAQATLADTGHALEQALAAIGAAVSERIGSLLDDIDGGQQQHVLDRETAAQLMQALQEVYDIVDGLFPEVSAIYDMVRHLL
jgi:hypothetical protein